MPDVRIGEELAERIAIEYGPDRSAHGAPSEWDFWSGPIQAALIGFRDFHSLRFDLGPSVRALHLVDPIFGALVFVAVLLEGDIVEIADFAVDPDYWAMIGDDPDE